MDIWSTCVYGDINKVFSVPLCHVNIPYLDIIQGGFQVLTLIVLVAFGAGD